MAVRGVLRRGILRNSRAEILFGKIVDERGSISILVFGLFFLMIAMVFILTDVASMIVAQRSLVSASENAVIQGAHVLDRDAYYRGTDGENVPLNCGSARLVVMKELEAWGREGKSIRRLEVSSITLEDFYCSGDELQISTSAQFMIPFVLPNSQFQRYDLKAKVGATSRRVK